MSKQIKVGMMCFLVNCMDKENNGAIVHVQERAINQTVAGYNGPQDGWIVNAERKIKTIVLSEDHKQMHRLPGQKFFVKAHQLLPIDADPDSTENEEWMPLVNKGRAECKTNPVPA